MKDRTGRTSRPVLGGDQPSPTSLRTWGDRHASLLTCVFKLAEAHGVAVQDLCVVSRSISSWSVPLPRPVMRTRTGRPGSMTCASSDPSASSASASARYSEATEGWRPALLPALIVSFFAMSGRDTLVLQRDGEGEHVVVDDLGASAVVTLGSGGLLALQGLLSDVVTVELGGDGEHGEEHRAHAVGVVDAR